MIEQSKWLKIVPWFLSCGAAFAALINALGRIEGFYIWLICNLGFIIVCLKKKDYSQIPMWAVYMFTSILGIVIWSHK